MIENQVIIDFFKALASEKRQEILLNVFLDGNAHTVTEVAGRSNIALSTASIHLSILKRANILLSEKVGKDVLYTGNREYMAEMFKTLAKKFTCC